MLNFLLRLWFQPLMMSFAAADVAIADTGGADAGTSDGGGTQAGEALDTTDANDATGASSADDAGGDGQSGSDPNASSERKTEAKLDSRGLPPKVKETLDSLQKADPKAHGWLKDRLFSERRFREEFPGGVQEAKTLKASLSGLRELVPPTLANGSTQDMLGAIQEELSEGRALDELFEKGDPALFQKMIEFSADGFKKLLPVALREYAKTDVDGYRRDMAGIIASELAGQNVINRLGFVGRLLAKGDVEGVKEEISAIVEGLKQYDTIAAEKPRQAEPNPQADQRGKELDDREFKLWVNETATPINTAKTQAIKNELKQYLKDQAVDDETYGALENQVLRYVNDILQADPSFGPTFNAFIENRDRAGVTRFMASKMKEILPSKVVGGQRRMGPVERAFKLFFRGVKPAAQGGQQQQRQYGQQQQQKPAPKGWEKIDASKAPQPHEIDRAKTSFEMSFGRAAILKNGKKVFWGDQAPA